MIKTNYKKFAKGTYTYNITMDDIDVYKNPIIINYSLDFVPKYVFCHIPGGLNTLSSYSESIDYPIFSSCYKQRLTVDENPYISNINKNSFSIVASNKDGANIIRNMNYSNKVLTIDWIAIG